MNKAIELRLKHTKLVIQGKTSEADKVLREIWNLDKGIKEEPKKKKVIKPKRLKKNVSKKKKSIRKLK